MLTTCYMVCVGLCNGGTHRFYTDFVKDFIAKPGLCSYVVYCEQFHTYQMKNKQHLFVIVKIHPKQRVPLLLQSTRSMLNDQLKSLIFLKIYDSHLLASAPICLRSNMSCHEHKESHLAFIN